MMLSRLILNPLNRDVAACVRDPYRLHQLVMKGFGGASESPRAAFGVLHRLDVDPRTGALALLVQSSVAPAWDELPRSLLAETLPPIANPAVRSLDDVWERLEAGARLAFRLRANVTRKVETKSRADGGRRNGRRVGVLDESARMAWLVRKGTEAGFELVAADGDALDVRVTEEPPQRSIRAGGVLVHEAVRFDGRLCISDAARFRSALAAGIGPAKAFGFGLLSIAPAP